MAMFQLLAFSFHLSALYKVLRTGLLYISFPYHGQGPMHLVSWAEPHPEGLLTL